MNYYLDQEFHEYFKKPISWLPTIGKFNKPYHTIELISIGIISEDGREYYAICNEFDLGQAKKNSWLNENVLTPIENDLYQSESQYAKTYFSSSLTLKNLLKWKGKSKKQIAMDVVDFIDQRYLDKNDSSRGFIYPVHTSLKQVQTTDLSFYGYYADYDWVLFCSLFGTMMDLPKGMPMFCHDLKQTLNEKAKIIRDKMLEEQKDEPILNFKPDVEAVAKSSIQSRVDYPKQTNEHHALADAKWNMELHKFLKTIKD